MSDFLNNLNERKRQIERSGNDKFKVRRDFCIAHLPEVASRAVELIKDAFAEQYEKPELRYRESAEDRDNYVTIRYNRDNHAAWQVGTWPPYELPNRMVIKDYSVYLIDTGDIVSVSNYWQDAMPARVEPYDPLRYETETLNAMTIYHNIAQLPGDPQFQRQCEEDIPK